MGGVHLWGGCSGIHQLAHVIVAFAFRWVHTSRSSIWWIKCSNWSRERKPWRMAIGLPAPHWAIWYLLAWWLTLFIFIFFFCFVCCLIIPFCHLATPQKHKHSLLFFVFGCIRHPYGWKIALPTKWERIPTQREAEYKYPPPACSGFLKNGKLLKVQVAYLYIYFAYFDH